MLSKNELLYTLALQRVPNLGDTSAKKLLQAVGSAEGIFKENKNHLLKVDGIGALKLKSLNVSFQLPEAEAELQFIESNDISYHYFLDNDYPERLKHCLDGPILFFRRGNIDLVGKKVISVVGTRKITNYGAAFVEKFMNDIAPLNPVIISGFAYGVDIAAQSAALNLGLQTIGCLAHGLNQIYPKVHRKYAAKIEEHGGFVTEFWSSDVFDRNNFLKRNRIIAGLSEATVVIESAEKGGSLVTADIANSYNRDVFAVPGRTTDLQSRGCNNLLKSQQAQMITSAADLIYVLGWDIEDVKPRPRQTQLFVDLTQDEKSIFQLLKEKDSVLLDDLTLSSAMPINKVASVLLGLEMKGLIIPLPGKRFKEVSSF